uniref:Uncharacterized protein n=1 Tax=Anguilla anguilla TaxID=7936 RepID=A0A0E9V144_ANGAN
MVNAFSFKKISFIGNTFSSVILNFPSVRWNSTHDRVQTPSEGPSDQVERLLFSNIYPTLFEATSSHRWENRSAVEVI